VAALVLATAVRIVFLFQGGPDEIADFGISDPSYYHFQANLVADGVGFVEPFEHDFRFRTTPSATHPPVYVVVLAAGSFLGGTSLRWHQLLSIGLGIGTVWLIALVARRVAGPRAGVIAATVAAVYPHFWLNDTTLTAETPFALVTALLLLVVLVFLDRPDPRLAAAMGAIVGLAALTRGEGVLFLLVLVLPAIWVRSESVRRAVSLGALAIVCSLVVITPWVLRNLTTFREPVLLSTNADDVIGGSNCAPAYSGPGIGGWHLSCLDEKRPGEDESETTRRHRQAAIDYARRHWTELPEVALVRVARLWDVYDPFGNNPAREGRPHWASRLVLFGYWATLPWAVAGLVLLRRRPAALLPLLAPVVVVTVTALMSWGAVRFRIPAEVSLIVLAGAGADGVWRRLRG
jgi:4-amino-4-deoxy-L-arabinose transferase-like glycosyltransferase